MRFGVPDEIGFAAVAAVIDEQRCIGCTLCIQACPVDAIVGAAKLMHTVVPGLCTGCELCLPPCPVDCITMLPVTRPGGGALVAATQAARRRCEARNQRLRSAEDEKAERVAARRAAGLEQKKRDTIARALERAALRLAGRDR